MTRDEYLLTQAADEAVEVAQRLHKAMQFGVSEVQPGQPFTNAERIVQEMTDLAAAFQLLEEAGLITRPDNAFLHEQIEKKKAKVRRYMDYARQQGTLKDK